MVRFDLGPLLQGQTTIAELKVLVLEVCNMKPTYRRSWAGNLLMFSDLTLVSSFIYLFIWGFYVAFNTVQGSWKGRGNQYIQFVRVLYCKVPTNCKQLPAFPLEAVREPESRPQRWEARVLPLCHCGPCLLLQGQMMVHWLW